MLHVVWLAVVHLRNRTQTSDSSDPKNPSSFRSLRRTSPPLRISPPQQFPSGFSIIVPDGQTSKAQEADFTKDDKKSYLNVHPTAVGNYAVGLSTTPREIALSGKDFNEYLYEDGIPDRNELDEAVREWYSKQVKTIFQVADVQTGNYKFEFRICEFIRRRTRSYGKVGETNRTH